MFARDELERVIEVRGPRPDFYVQSPAGPFLAEVKAFSELGPIERRVGPVFSVVVEELLRTISSAFDEARQQLRPYRDLGIPAVVVLDNWRQVGVDLGDAILIQIFGQIQFVVPVAPAGGRDLQNGWVYVRESKTEAGRRKIPLTPRVRTELRMYLLDERPHQEPGAFFLNEQGRPFTYYGWSNLAQNLIRTRLRQAGINDFKFHRLRNTKTLLARRAGWSDTVIKSVMGWEGFEMIERYAGQPADEELKMLPSTTERFFRAS